MKYFIPSLANVLGALAAIAVIVGYSFLAQTDSKYISPSMQLAVDVAISHGLIVFFNVALLIGAVVALIISFIVTHVIEKVWE